MRLSKLSTAVLLGLGLVGMSAAQAESALNGDPLSTAGFIGSYNDYKTTIHHQDIDDHHKKKTKVGQYGAYYDYGNKLTGEEGWIYQAGILGQYGKKSKVNYYDVRLEAEGGYRWDVAGDSFIDVLGGLGYKWDRDEERVRRSDGFGHHKITMDNRNPYVKAGVGYNYLAPDVTVRLEAGGRYTFSGRVKVKGSGEELNSKHLDLKSQFNPYVELSALWNKGLGNLPVHTAIYYEHDTYKAKHHNDWHGVKTVNNEVGIKVGLGF